jgi:c-di-GMP-binding flagellar brake protein YcgR
MTVIFKRNKKTARVQERRQVERNDAEWTTQYTLEGLREHGWRECRVLDVSRDGIGLQLHEVTPDQLSTYRVIIAVDVPRASLRLRGDVRHLEEVDNGEVRVGVEFSALSAFERDLFDAFLETSPLASAAA